MSIVLWAIASQIAMAGAQVSSFKKDSRRGNNYWNAGSAIDGNPETAWMVTGESENKGEWIQIDGPSGATALTAISMVIGYAASEDKFFDYSRVKEIRIDVLEYDTSLDLKPTSKSKIIQFEDKIEQQTIPMEELKIESENGGKFKITITDFYPGKDYTALGVSEVMLHLKEYDTDAKILGVENGAEGSDELDLIDKSTKSYWLANSGAKVTLSGTMSSIGIVSGPSTYARPKKVKISTGGRTLTHELQNTPKEQWVLVPSVTGYTGSNWDDVTIEVLEVYPGKKEQIAIAEIKQKVTSFSAF